jgi:dolichyl-phosphate-mannose--protein O-mannosyl transferase
VAKPIHLETLKNEMSDNELVFGLHPYLIYAHFPPSPSSTSSSSSSSTVFGINREKLERAQNLEHVEQLSKGLGTDVVKFGDIIQLQHVISEKFLATHKTPARLNPNCRKVSLKEGSRAANFRIISRYKVNNLQPFYTYRYT